VSRALTDEQRLDWLQLARSENVGPRTFVNLLGHFGSAGMALDALPDLAQRGGASRAIKIYPRDAAVRELEAARRMDVAFVALDEPDYPEWLQAIHDPPPLIALRGERSVLAMPMVAIVGARNASAAGARFAERIAHDLGQAGFAVVSGLARGIDGAAHRASLTTGTIAVLAGGHDRIYPPEHEDLLNSVLEHGAAISEMPLGWEPRAHDFPRRNRLISGLSLGVVIVEAAKRSGSLITARFALEQGREVFVVPGSPLDPRAEGSNGLLKQGAVVTTEAADVISVLQPMIERSVRRSVEEPERSPPPSPPGDDGARARIVSLLGPTPVSIDDLIRLSGQPASVVRITLLELEIAGRLTWQPGGLVALLDL
jgi:DNA processing protein